MSASDGSYGTPGLEHFGIADEQDLFVAQLFQSEPVFPW
ncbi:hypothetical protein trd_1765 [Thermomicrobium roseum DSM 5159]|uniref:Uncharacterized protein n=1 Tax=Thermomicrobium roseum (strain ATCC 27502 / DSM 5159 / P-2) TaxID=309801 RepID=B9L154_THERP|nr:hypothetical protein trd_1765 [Thermomicrobium roseum DSM 5159]